MWKNIFLLLAVLGTTLGATIHPCSNESCPEEQLQTTSFEFLSKFTQKQFSSIVNLTMVNASVNKVDPKLKYLKNLIHLDLSYNNVDITSIPKLYNLKTLILKANSLKNINMTALPPNIEVLDISHNLLTQIPKDWISLKALKTLHLYKNPIDCDCNNGNVLNHERLILSGVKVPRAVTCYSPNKFQGKDVSSISCSMADIMLYDEPVEGSGSSDIFNTEEGTNIPLVQEEDDENVIEGNTIVDDKKNEFLDGPTTTYPQSESAFLGDEGSGDEGSGFEMLGCIGSCSTPGPVGANDSEYDSPLPSVIDQFKILYNDLFKEEEITHPIITPTTTSTTSSTSITATTSTSTVAPSTVPPIVEPEIVKETESRLEKVSDKEDVEMISNSTNTSELERASIAPKDSTAVYAIIGVGLFLGVLFLIAFLKNRKSKRRQNKNDIPNTHGEEMKPLNKMSITTFNNEKPNRKSNIPENAPLINGQNGKAKVDTPMLTSFTPLAHPELPQNGRSDADEPAKENGHINDEDEVDIRPKTQPESLTPQRERVTIRESEIPDSIPKTPLLIHRQKNSEGEIIMVVP